MRKTTCLPVGLAGVLVFSGPADVAAQQVLPRLTTPPPVEVVEGDTGSTLVELPFVLDKVHTADVSFDVFVRWDSWRAVPEADFADFPRRTLTIRAGQTGVSAVVEVYGDTHIESEQSFEVRTDALTGADYANGSGYGTTITILDDDVQDIGAWEVRDDYLEIAANFPFDTLDLTANDSTDRSWYDAQALSFEMIEAPAKGSFQYQGGGRGRFHLEPGMLGAYSFQYRLCLHATCKEAWATVNVMPFSPPSFAEPGHSGYREVFGTGVAGYGITTTPLVAPQYLEIPVPVDRSPQDPWDSEVGTTTRIFTVPASPAGEPTEYLVHVQVEAGSGARLFAGVDTDGDGTLAPHELQCAALRPECTLTLASGAAPAAWVLRLHNASQYPALAPVTISTVPVVDPAGLLTATGPGRDNGWAFQDVHLGWNDPSLLAGEWRVGFARITRPDGSDLMDVPVRVRRDVNYDSPPVVLVPGEAKALRLGGVEFHPRLLVDVPAGAQSLQVQAFSDAPGGTPFHLVRKSDPIDATDTAIEAAPPVAQASASGIATAQGAIITVNGGALAPGRWYVVPENRGDDAVSLSFTAHIEGLAPLVRPGSYYNPSRGGSGIFLYPAGDQWTGLWYTYFADGRPTWYYLQAPVAGENGIWHSQVMRATWNGSTRTLTAVGEANLTPVGTDAFTLTYTIDGVAGSQPMQGLGRGCPTAGGQPLDASSTWFDPAKAGTGYSLQLWEDYEYLAAFVYDEQGVPMFLAAELGRFGGDDATLVLQRLTGACPTCDFTESVRADVGTLARRFSGGALASIELDAVWQDGNPPYWLPPVSTWSAVDAVQLLGGAGTTQGCAP